MGLNGELDDPSPHGEESGLQRRHSERIYSTSNFMLTHHSHASSQDYCLIRLGCAAIYTLAKLLVLMKSVASLGETGLQLYGREKKMEKMWIVGL